MNTIPSHRPNKTTKLSPLLALLLFGSPAVALAVWITGQKCVLLPTEAIVEENMERSPCEEDLSCSLKCDKIANFPYPAGNCVTNNPSDRCDLVTPFTVTQYLTRGDCGWVPIRPTYAIGHPHNECKCVVPRDATPYITNTPAATCTR